MDEYKYTSALYDKNADFKAFVDKTSKGYCKTPFDVLRMKTTYYVGKDYDKGGVNATRGKRED